MDSYPGEEKIVAFIDIGTNAIRLSVVRIDRDHHHTNITQQREPVRLGEGEFEDRVLQPHAMQQAVLVCKKFVELSQAHGAEEIIAVATSATREAVNGDEFIQRLHREAGVKARVISGKEEARLTYQGLASFVHLGTSKALFIDIGGGSTEVIVGGQHKFTYLDSIRAGAVRLTALYLSPNETLPVPPDVYQTLRHQARIAASNALNNVRRHQPDLAFGTSGTIQNLAAIAARSARNRAANEANVLSLSELRRVTAILCALPLDERKKVSGLNRDRADIIIGGAAILDVIMEELGFSEITVLSEGGLRDGLLVDYLEQRTHDPERASARERSVVRLGRACKFDEKHARKAERLALDLFDSAKEAGLHSYGDRERELLGYAALLHDIGAFLSYSSHNVHSSYLIANSDLLLGFHQAEINIMSLAALFHRKGLPTSRQRGYAALDRDLRQLVAFLSLILRLVESLDRSHQGVVEHAQFSASGPKDLSLNVQTSEDAQLELWGIESRKRAVRKTLKKHLRIFVNGQPYLTDFATEPPPESPAAG